ncbi:MAG: hypothetical protein K0R72_166 [Clostridia bacterium]|jgi:hypothetical protein|nr:hypothetical protein [Clostridia bacterium]
MKETRVSDNVVQKVSENGEIKYWKKAKYNMNIYYTKLAENVYEQMGISYAKNTICQEGANRYLVTEDIQKDKELYLGKSITNSRELSSIREDLKQFLTDKRNKSR